VPQSEQVVDNLVDAILDGTPIDWAAAESSGEGAAPPLLRQLKVLAAIAAFAPCDHGRASASLDEAERSRADLHCNAPPIAPSERPVSLAERKGGDAPEHWGHLRLVEPVGRGASGKVYRAWDTRLDREVALKLLPADRGSEDRASSSIIHEGRLLARVRHPNVVTIHGAEQIGDQIGLWMEFIRGHTLEQLLQQQTVFSAADVVEVGLELCRAVSAVHGAGLLHRDIKAHNVMRAEDGRIVLMDFGTGREREDNASSDLTGTPLYVAPEVLAGGPATVQSDIYSLGVLLYHVATNSYPVRGRTVREIRQVHERGDRIASRSVRPDLHSALARAIDQACDPRPERRFANADALARALLALQRRPAIRALRYGFGACAAVFLAALLMSEVRARLTGAHPSLARRLAALIAAAPNPLEHPVIAVLPFRNLGSDASGDLLVDSVTIGLIRQLGVIDGLQVRSQTSSFMFRDKPRNLADVGKRLSANLVVEGDAQVADDMLRINAALVSVAGGTTLWSDTVERQLRSEGDLVGLVEELTRTIVNKLRLKLGPTQRRYETDIATFQKYLKARALRDARGQQARASIALLEEVMRADPSFAPAKAALAAVYGFLASRHPGVDGATIPRSEAAELMEPLTRSALEIDPMLAEAHAAQGHLHAIALRWTDAEASFRRAIELEPNLTSVYADFVLSTLLPWGRLDESLDLLEAALEADPLALDLRRVLADAQLNAGLYAEARDNARRVLAVDTNHPYVDYILAWALLFNGERAEALERLEKAIGRPGGLPGRPGVRGYIHAINGRRAEAEAIAAQFAAQFPQLPQRQAEIYGLLGDKDRALQALERLAALNPGRAATFLNHPEIGLRGDPRAEAFRRKLRFPQ
jgi:eukaryotic-like serine/threonine-protein kinase